MEIQANSNENTQIVNTDTENQGNLQDNQQGVETQTQDNINQTTATEPEVKSPEEDKPAGEPNIAQMQETTEALKNDLETRGVDFTALENEYLAQGKLSEASLEALSKAGYPREVVAGYLKGVEQENQAYYNTVIGYVGSEQDYNAMTQFIQSKGEASVTAFNNAIEAGNLEVIRLMVQGIKSEMATTNGTSNRTLLGGSGVAQGQTTGGFDSKEEMVEAMSDKRYGKDKKYTAEVERRTKLATFM